MKTILVTGAAGYIGSVAVHVLLNKGYEVVGLDNLLYGGESLVSLLFHPHFHFIKADITDTKGLEAIFKQRQFFGVIHLAAIVGDPACAKNQELAKKVNESGSRNLLDFALTHSVERFIFASTCSNYGKMSDSAGYADETFPLAPVSLYAKLKVAFEKELLEASFKNHTFSPTALRFATVYGISPRMRFDLTINEFTKELTLGKELSVFGESFWRPYIHVADLARALTFVLEAQKEKVAHTVFNVGDTQENYQKKEIVEEIKKIIPASRVQYVPAHDDPRDYRVSFEKIKHELGFCVTKRVPDGIKEIHDALTNGIWLNPDEQKYRNV